MAKRKNKMLNDKKEFVSHLAANRKPKKKLSKNKKKPSEIRDDPIPTSRLSSASVSCTVATVGAIAAPVSISTTATEHKVDTRMEENQYEENSLSGYIFMCNQKTKPQCYQYRVFGLPMGKMEVVKKIKVGMKLFLFDFDLKLLYGVYKATSNGGLGLEPAAFEGGFPAQVKFMIFKDCLPLQESALRHSIADIYLGGSKFRQELSGKQVKTLISLFRPLPAPLQAPAVPLPNMALPCSFGPSVMGERLQLPPRPPLSKDPFIPVVNHLNVPPALDYHSAQGTPPPLYNCYRPEAHVAHAQPPVEGRHIVPQAFPTHHAGPYYLDGAHEPYYPENPILSTHDSYKRCDVAPAMIPRDQPLDYGSEYHVSELQREREIVPHSEYVVDYYDQGLPPAGSSYAPPRPYALLESCSLDVLSASHAEIVTDSEHVVGYRNQQLPPTRSSYAPPGAHAFSESDAPLPASHVEVVTHRERGVGYYNQHLPPAGSSYAPPQAHAFIQYHTQLPVSCAPGSLPSSYQAHHTMPVLEDHSRPQVDSHQISVHVRPDFAGVYAYLDTRQTLAAAMPNLAGANMPVSALYSFAGATPTHK